MKWKKAIKELPKYSGQENEVIIRSLNKNIPFVTTGFKNYNEDNPQLYFVLGQFSYLTNLEGKYDGRTTFPLADLEWLDESK